MNGFLVVARCLQDDVPLRLFNGVKEAMDFALANSEDALITMSEDVFSVDISQVVCLTLIEFVNGSPINRSLLRDFEQESEQSEDQ